MEASYLEHADQDGYKGHAIEGQSGDIDFGHGYGFVVNLIIECEEHEQTDDGQHQHEDAQKEACRIQKKENVKMSSLCAPPLKIDLYLPWHSRPNNDVGIVVLQLSMKLNFRDGGVRICRRSSTSSKEWRRR